MAAGLDMIPRDAMHYFPHSARVDRKGAANLRERASFGLFSNVEYDFNGQLANTVVLSLKAGASSLADAISLIVQIAANKEMGWIAAGRIVAFVQNVFRVGQRTVGLFVDSACRQLTTTQASASVFIGIFASPRPARIWSSRFVNARPDLIGLGSPSARAAEFTF